MLNATIADSRLATECDRRGTEYKKENGCSMEELVQRLWPAGWSTAAGERRSWTGLCGGCERVKTRNAGYKDYGFDDIFMMTRQEKRTFMLLEIV